MTTKEKLKYHTGVSYRLKVNNKHLLWPKLWAGTHLISLSLSLSKLCQSHNVIKRNLLITVFTMPSNMTNCSGNIHQALELE